jgi:hypothetical protein
LEGEEEEGQALPALVGLGVLPPALFNSHPGVALKVRASHYMTCFGCGLGLGMCAINAALCILHASNHALEAEAEARWPSAVDLHDVMSSGKVFRNTFHTNGVCMDIIHTHKRATGAEAGAKAARQLSIAVSGIFKVTKCISKPLVHPSVQLVYACLDMHAQASVFFAYTSLRFLLCCCSLL